MRDIKLEHILFIDIETVPQYGNFDEMPSTFQHLWEDKTKQFKMDEKTASELYARAGIYAEFGKIVCISTGFIVEKPSRKMRIRSFYGDNEKQILIDFFELLNKYYSRQEHALCAHNGKEFDFPYICRRAVVNGIPIPQILDVAGKKPWEVKNLDTMELWKFGDYKHYTGLKLLTEIFGIPSPKDDIAGDQVAEVYYVEKNLKRIATYCEKDVLALAQVFLKYRFENTIDMENVEFCNPTD